MNTIGHILFAHILVLFAARDDVSLTTLIVTGLASVLIDLDHITKVGHAIKKGRFGPSTRTRWHELFGLFVFMSISVYVSVFSASIGRSLLIGFVSHYFLDLLTRPTRPLYPMSEKLVFLKLAPRGLRELVAYDAILTIVMGVIWVWSLHDLGLLYFLK